MKNYKDKIIELRRSGKTYQEIANILNCASSTVVYHLRPIVRSNAIKRAYKNKMKNPQKARNLNTICQQKLYNFKCDSKKGTKKKYSPSPISINDIRNLVYISPKCYLTGRNIDVLDSSSWSLDHIIPRSKGGPSTMQNLGISSSIANKCKHDLSLDEFLILCQEVLQNFGFRIVKDGGDVGVLPSESL